MDLIEYAPLGARTTFKVGGEARYLALGHSDSDIKEAKAFAESESMPLLVLGLGSNILADDGVSEAVFFAPTYFGVDIKTQGDNALLSVGASERWDDVVSYAVENGYFGLENLSGIPGTVGGAVVQNIGAYGAALSGTCSEVEVYDLKENAKRILTATECAFGYRDSIFKKTPDRFLILRATFLLKSVGEVDISYRDLKEVFGASSPEVEAVRAQVLSIRARKFPDLSVEGTAGSFFKNPIIGKKDAEALKIRFPEVPLYMVPEEEGVKIPLAWFLDRILGLRGYTEGFVRCFEQQPLVIVASTGATAADVRRFAQKIQKRVLFEIGLNITPEVCVLSKNIFQSRVDF